MGSDTQVQLAPGVHYQSLGDGEDGVLLSMESGYLYRCNHTAVALLDALSDKPTLGELVARVANRYGQSDGTVQEDLSQFVEQLIEEQLIVKAA
jgi:hypothetical protein